MLTALKTVAQDAMNGKLAEKTAILFDKKLPPPDLKNYPGYSLPGNIRAGMQNTRMQSLKMLMQTMVR